MKTTVKFENDDGSTVTAVFDREAGTVSSDDGRSGTFKRAENSRVMELSGGGESVTLTFESDIVFEVGHAARFTDSVGRKGKATILAIA